MVAYGEFRCSYENDPIDHRIIFFGLRYILDNYIAKQWTRQDLDIFDKFLSTHNVSHSPFPYPKRLFERIIEEFNGWFPVRIEALDEGSIIAPHVPVYTITAEKDFAPLVTFLETILTMVWVIFLFNFKFYFYFHANFIFNSFQFFIHANFIFYLVHFNSNFPFLFSIPAQ